MAELRFVCPFCGLEHQGLPDLAYASPGCWDAAAVREPHLNRLDSDACIVDGRHFFIRCTLLVPIRDTGQRLGWGVWVS